MATPWYRYGIIMASVCHHYGTMALHQVYFVWNFPLRCRKQQKYHLYHNHHHFIETLKGVVTSSHSNPLVFQISAGGYQVDTRWIPCGHLVDTRWIPASARDSISLDLRLLQLDMIKRHLLISWSCYHWTDNICFWKWASVTSCYIFQSHMYFIYAGANHKGPNSLQPAPNKI